MNLFTCFSLFNSPHILSAFRFVSQLCTSFHNIVTKRTFCSARLYRTNSAHVMRPCHQQLLLGKLLVMAMIAVLAMPVYGVDEVPEGFDFNKMLATTYNRVAEHESDYIYFVEPIKNSDDYHRPALKFFKLLNKQEKVEPETPPYTLVGRYDYSLDGDVMKIRCYLYEQDVDMGFIDQTQYLGRWCECIFKYDCSQKEWQLIGTIFHDSRQ